MLTAEEVQAELAKV
jgi:putative transposase